MIGAKVVAHERSRTNGNTSTGDDLRGLDVSSFSTSAADVGASKASAEDRSTVTVTSLPAIRSLEQRARYLVYCMFVCLFVNDFSTTRGPIHAIFCMRA